MIMQIGQQISLDKDSGHVMHCADVPVRSDADDSKHSDKAREGIDIPHRDVLAAQAQAVAAAGAGGSRGRHLACHDGGAGAPAALRCPPVWRQHRALA